MKKKQQPLLAFTLPLANTQMSDMNAQQTERKKGRDARVTGVQVFQKKCVIYVHIFICKKYFPAISKIGFHLMKVKKTEQNATNKSNFLSSCTSTNSSVFLTRLNFSCR